VLSRQRVEPSSCIESIVRQRAFRRYSICTRNLCFAIIVSIRSNRARPPWLLNLMQEIKRAFAARVHRRPQARAVTDLDLANLLAMFTKP
jgi:hypothetical protein